MSEPEQVIGLKDIYAEVVRLVGHMEAVSERNRQADLIHVDHETRLRTLEKLPDPSDHETRLRTLERWRYGLPTSLVISLGSTAVALASLLNTHH